MTRNKLLIRILGIFLIGIVSILLLEGSIRIYSTLAFPKMMVIDDALGWRHASNAERFFTNEYGQKILVVQNKYGFRRKEYGYEKKDGKYRILILGDSYTEGVHAGEDDIFSSLIEQSSPDFEVINAGVGGYGTVQEYMFLVAEGIAFHPDTVFLMFYDNDLTDNCLSYSPGFGPRPYVSRSSGNFRIETKLDPSKFSKFLIPIPYGLELHEVSYLYYFINSRIYHSFFSEKFRALLKTDMAIANKCGTYETFFYMLEKMRDYLTERNVDFVLVLIPSKEEAHTGISETHAPIVEYSRKHGIAYLPLTKALHKAKINSGSDPYFPTDIHWNNLGHKIAASEMIKLTNSRRNR